jgi:hypothetical protein
MDGRFFLKHHAGRVLFVYHMARRWRAILLRQAQKPLFSSAKTFSLFFFVYPCTAVEFSVTTSYKAKGTGKEALKLFQPF